MTAISWIPINMLVRGRTYQAGEVDAWLTDFFTQIDSLDLTQTGDTGQYAYGTTSTYEAMPAGGGLLAYRIYRLDDDLVTEAPLYIKLQFNAVAGSKTASGGFSVRGVVTAGTQTDGAGNIIKDAVSFGISSGHSTNDAVAFSSDSNQSFACTLPNKGFFGLVFNAGQHAHTYYVHRYAPFAFCLERIPNADGTPSSLGFTLFSNDYNGEGKNYNDGENNTNVSVIKATTKVFNGGKTYSNTAGVPYFPQTSLISSGILINHFFHSTPYPVRSIGVVAIPSNKLSKGTQFEVIPYGTQVINFVAMDNACAMRSTSITNMVLAFAFE